MKKIFNNQGYFLANILTALGIITLLITISIPVYRRYQPNIKLNGNARSLVADLRLAQQLTVTEQDVYGAFFDLSGDSYEIFKIDGATTTIKTVEFDEKVSYQQISGLSEDYIIFNYYGAVNEAGQIVLVNNYGKTKTINIKPSGYVQLQ